MKKTHAVMLSLALLPASGRADTTITTKAQAEAFGKACAQTQFSSYLGAAISQVVNTYMYGADAAAQNCQQKGYYMTYVAPQPIYAVIRTDAKGTPTPPAVSPNYQQIQYPPFNTTNCPGAQPASIYYTGGVIIRGGATGGNLSAYAQQAYYITLGGLVGSTFNTYYSYCTPSPDSSSSKSRSSSSGGG